MDGFRIHGSGIPIALQRHEEMCTYGTLPPMQYPLYINGKNKQDTSAYARRHFLEHIYAGHGGAYFDFSRDITPLTRHIPARRRTDVILFAPMDRDYPIGLNPIPLLPPSTIVDIFKSVHHYDRGDVATPNFDTYMYATIAALRCHPDSTLRNVVHLLKRKDYREQVMRHITDPDLHTFWGDYDKLSDKKRDDITDSTINKIYPLITDPIVRNIIGQKKTAFTLTPRSILIATFPQELGREKGSFLATLLLSIVPDGMLTVLDDGHRLGFSAVLDAIHRFDLVFSHQYAAQLSPMLYETLIGTAATLVAFRTSPTDAKRLRPEFYLFPQDDHLNELAPGKYYVRYPSTTDRRQHTIEPLEFPAGSAEQVRDVSRQLNVLNVIGRLPYATPRERVEAQLRSPLDAHPKRGARSKHANGGGHHATQTDPKPEVWRRAVIKRQLRA